MNPHHKRKLSDSEKEKIDIPSHWSAFEFGLDKVIEERCDEFEYELEEHGYEIFNRDYIRVATSIYNFRVIAAKES